MYKFTTLLFIFYFSGDLGEVVVADYIEAFSPVARYVERRIHFNTEPCEEPTTPPPGTCPPCQDPTSTPSTRTTTTAAMTTAATSSITSPKAETTPQNSGGGGGGGDKPRKPRTL